MKLLKNSKELMSIFESANHSSLKQQNRTTHTTQTTQTKNIFKELYFHLFNSYTYLQQQGSFFTINVKKISNVRHITKPKMFNDDSIPYEIRNCINKESLTEILYQFSLYNRKIKIYFVLNEIYTPTIVNKYNHYVRVIAMWIYMLNQYASNKCSKTLILYFYFTSHKKVLPQTENIVIDQIHVNTGFTTTCPINSEIVIYRKEEWFKVFIHETFHNFALDFSDMNTTTSKKCILDIFQVHSKVNLYETYTEFWAEIINILFCSFFSIKNKTDFHSFLLNTERFIQIERKHGCFQLVKTLNHMKLRYTDLFTNSSSLQSKSKLLYKEKTNVLAYYILKTILMNNYQSFLHWSKTTNPSLLHFKKTIVAQKEMCLHIYHNYKTSSMLNEVAYAEQFFKRVYNHPRSRKINDILTNLRMTICELG